MKHIKLFENFINEDENAGEEFKMITHDWNSYLVPVASLKTRPQMDFGYRKPGGGFTTTGDIAKAGAEADKRWIERIERYYVMPELKKEWECKEGWGCKKKPEKIVKDVHFKVITTNTIQHTKIAHGAPTKELKNAKVAVPLSYKEEINTTENEKS